MPGGIFSCHKWGVSATGMQLTEGKYAAKHSQCTGHLTLPKEGITWSKMSVVLRLRNSDLHFTMLLFTNYEQFRSAD